MMNYFKIAWRNLSRNKLSSTINITGLAIGLAVCMLIMLYVKHESGYDRFHKNAERIFWIQGKLKMGNDSIFMPMMSFATGPLAKQSNSFVENFVRLRRDNKGPVIQNTLTPALRFAEPDFLFADSNFFQFFSFKLERGNIATVLQSPFSVVISPKMARKYFGDEDPVGKTIRYNSEYDFRVTGIAEKSPSNSSIDFDFVASLSSLSSMAELKPLIESQRVQLGAFSTYFLLSDKADAPRLEANLLALNKTTMGSKENNERYIATPLLQTHLNANFGDASNVKYLNIFPLVAALVLLLALVNYMSLSVARSTERAREIGIRKVVGANRKSVALQFFIESALCASISFGIGYMLCAICEPIFFGFLQIDIDNAFLYSSEMLLTYTFLLIITIVIAATYPAILLSAHKPVMVLYGKFSKKAGGAGIRKFFTVFQFSIAAALIICAVVIDRQMFFFRHKDTGVDRERVAMIPFPANIGSHYASLKKEVQSLAAVKQISTAHYPMYKGYDIFFVKTKSSREDMSLPILAVDENFIPMLGLKWKLTPANKQFNQSENSAILNEAAVTRMQLGANPLNEQFSMGGQSIWVAGVLKDFNYQSLHTKIDPLCIFVSNEKDSLSAWGKAGGCLFVKIKPLTNMPVLMERLKSIYEKFDQTKPFEYYFMDEAFDSMYKAEDRLSKIFSVFTFITMLIACFGLLGLSTFVALQRTKEIGIRKVLGASVAQVAALLSGEFVKLVLLAIVVATPVAWWIMSKWLEEFAYRIKISWWMVGVAAILLMVVALGTIAFQAAKAAVANPVKSLRTE